jgi:hypothetical protein
MVALPHPLKLALVALVASAAIARADAPTGLVVIGDGSMQPALRDALDAWLLHHGRTVVGEPLDRDGVVTITNCVQAQDLTCARGVVEKRSKTDAVVYAQVGKPKNQTVAIDVYWIVKGREAVSERRACEECNADAMRGTVDTIMNELAANAGQSGRLRVSSKPPGATVVLDHEVVGVAPVERDVTPGKHEIVLMQGTREAGARSVTLHAGETVEISIAMHLKPEPEKHSRIPGAITLGIGIAGMAAGVALYVGSQTDDGSRYKYTDTRPAGIGVGIGGLAATSIGLILLYNARTRDATPVVSVDAHGGMIGWARAF